MDKILDSFEITESFIPLTLLHLIVFLYEFFILLRCKNQRWALYSFFTHYYTWIKFWTHLVFWVRIKEEILIKKKVKYIYTKNLLIFVETHRLLDKEEIVSKESSQPVFHTTQLGHSSITKSSYGYLHLFPSIPHFKIPPQKNFLYSKNLIWPCLFEVCASFFPSKHFVLPSPSFWFTAFCDPAYIQTLIPSYITLLLLFVQAFLTIFIV